MATKQETAIYKVWANNERLKLLVCLSKAQNVTSLQGHCTLSQSALSQHLKVLRDAGMVTTDKKGKYVLYKIKKPEAVTIAKLLLRYK